MKKIFSVLLVAMIALSGCSSSAGGSDKPVESITIWTNMPQVYLGEEKIDSNGNTVRDEDTAWLKKIADEWTADTGIAVSFETIPGGDNSQLKNLITNNDASVDMVYAPISNVAFKPEDLPKYFVPWYDNEDDCLKELKYCGMGTNYVDGKTYAYVPAVGYDNVFVYNEEILEKLAYNQVPIEREEFLNMLAKAEENNITGTAIHRVENWPLQEYRSVAAYMTDGKNDKGELLGYEKPWADDAPLGMAQDFMIDIVANGYMEESAYADFGVAMDEVSFGKALGMLSGTWVLPQLQARTPEGSSATFAMAPWPTMGGTDQKLNVNLARNGEFTIPVGSDAIDESQQFAKFVVDHDLFVEYNGGLPNSKTAKDFTPDTFATIQPRIDSGEIELIEVAIVDEFIAKEDEILSDMGVYADYMYSGLVYDAAKTTGKDEAEKQQEALNEQWITAKEARGY